MDTNGFLASNIFDWVASCLMYEEGEKNGPRPQKPGVQYTKTVGCDNSIELTTELIVML